VRIISPFRDYYDSVQAVGQDQSLLYLRRPHEEKWKETPFPFTDALRRNYFCDNLLRDCYIVGFCGTIRPVLRLQHPSPSRTDIKPVLCYTLDDVDSFIRATFKTPAVERYFSKRRRNYWSETWRHLQHDQFDTFFQEAEARRNQYKHLFQGSRCPVFICQTGRECIITYNGCLKDVEFYRCVDPFTAFQEIQMFLGGLAAPEKPIPRTDDKTLAEAKGFNKWSFRKEPRNAHPD